ncbi:hypothetical protein [Frankia sp. AgB32]|uniref:hypothetical protein n=1 Tax=Frankia sp. AgB32 TaxID=631119 RepID=UPI002010851E|nr:hypothetical protein [Frankia sp. AgB32]MCK9895297.1 hypothetical protein [Frankia sp. AgB32]
MVVVVDPTVLTAHLGLLVSTAAQLGSAALEITGCLTETAGRADRNLASHRARLDAATRARHLAETEVERAQREIEAAQRSVAEAQAALDRARSQTWRDADGTEHHPDTSAEQAAVSRARERVTVARRALARVQAELEKAIAAVLGAERGTRAAGALCGRVGEQVANAAAVAEWISMFQQLATDASFLLTIKTDLLDQYLGDLPAQASIARAAAPAAALAVALSGLGGGLVGPLGLATQLGLSASGVTGVAGVAASLIDLSSAFGGGLGLLAEHWADDVGHRYRNAFAEPLAERLRGIAHAADDVSTAVGGITRDLEGSERDSTRRTEDG